MGSGSMCRRFLPYMSGKCLYVLAEKMEIKKTVDQRKISPRCAAEETAAKAGMCGMGIINSICRLKMIYGDDFNFSIFINETGGTTVRLEGPFQETGCADME